METTISIYLDTRRKKKKDLYPVKLRVYDNALKKAKLYPIKMALTIKDFQSTWETAKPRTEHKEKRLKLKAIESKANDVVQQLNPFTFTQFEKKLFRKTGEGENVFYQYDLLVGKLKGLERFGTASNYELSLKSIKNFIFKTKNVEPKQLLFSEITVDWLNNYESYMLGEGRSRTTVSFYLRALRTIFNIAIAEKEIDSEIYPFGKRKYQVPAVKNAKKALNNKQLKALFVAKPSTPEQEKARDFWFFSYACNGANVKDIAMLTWSNLQGDKIIFYRAKTINTSKAELTPVTVYINDFIKSIIKKYGNTNKDKHQLIFPFIANESSEIDNFNKIKNFTKFINQNLKKLAETIKLPSEISTYWARHSFATNSVRNGASLEFIQESLGHGNLKTTMNYFAGFEDKTKKQFANKLMQF